MAVPPDPPEPSGVPPAVPPEGPTRVLRPARRRVVGEDPLVPADPGPWTASSLDSLRTAIAVVAVLAVVALGIAVWALLRHNHRTLQPRGTGATAAEVSLLSSRVAGLSNDVRALSASLRGTDGSVRQLAGRVGSLQQSVGKNSAALPGKASAQRVAQLEAQVAKLNGQIAQLAAAQNGSQTTTSGQTMTTAPGG